MGTKRTRKKPNNVGCTRLEALNQTHAVEAFTQLVGGPVPFEAADLVAALEQHFAKADPESLLECTTCGGWSDDSVEACPFCGEAGEVVKEGEHPIASATKSASAIAIEVRQPDTAESGRPDSSADDASSLEAKAVEFEQTQRRALANYVDACRIAAELRDLYDSRPRTESFAVYAERRLRLRRTQVFALIAVHREGLAEVAAKHGIEIARTIASAPAERRPELVSMAAEGATVREVQARARSLYVRALPPAQRIENPEAVTLDLPTSREQAFRRSDDPTSLATIDDLPAFTRIEGVGGGAVWVSLRRSPDGALELSVSAEPR